MRNADTRQMFTVRFTTVDRNDRVVVRERSFRTAAARTRFLEQDDNVVETLAFADPE